MKLLTAALAATAAVSFLAAAPAKADSFVDLLNTIEATGTEIAVDHPDVCNDPGMFGKYFYEHNVIDAMVICMANHKGDTVELRDTVLHESVHVAQQCNGGPIFSPGSIFRAADERVINEVAKGYNSEQHHREIEARVIASEWDEAYVIGLLREYCFK